MQPLKPDSRVFASYPMPAKIDLLNERPRRESQVELELGNRIGLTTPNMPQITVNEQNINSSTTRTTGLGQPDRHWNGALASSGGSSGLGNDVKVDVYSTNINSSQQSVNVGTRSPTGRSEVKETRITINRHSGPVVVAQYYDKENSFANSKIQDGNSMLLHQQLQRQQLQQQQQQQQQAPQPHQQRQQQIRESIIQQQSDGQELRQSQVMGHAAPVPPGGTTVTTTTVKTTTISDNKTVLANELAEKEAKLMREIDALNQRPCSPYQTPGKVDLTNEQRVSMQQHQQQSQYGSSPRPGSSTSSSTGMELLEKEAKLLKEIEEIESKPFNPQTMIVEREQWFEYPENRPQDRHLTDSKRRVRDFCSMPEQFCQDRHIHEENIPIRNQPSPTPNSIHTAIIRSPKREIDNKSPLPFAFDNFTTKGVRGNIATVGAVEPDRPRPPIFPIVKRTPSPGLMQG